MDPTKSSDGNSQDVVAPSKDLVSHEDTELVKRPTNVDDAVLLAQGHQAAMPRRFSALAALGLAFSITGSWVGYASNFGQNLIYGGPQSVIFGLLVATVVQWIITLGLSEIGSAFPSSGGQYHFTYILAPEKHKRFAAFVLGWMTILGWWIVTCSGVSLFAISVYGTASFWYPDFQATQWQVWLLYLLTILLTVSPLALLPKHIPKITQTCLLLSVLGFFVNFVLTLALRKHTQPASFITQPGLGTSSWNTGVAWMLGVTNAMYAYGGTDGAIHIAEEMINPGRRIPQVMSLTMFIGFMTAFPLMMAMMYTITDINAITTSALPSLEVFYQSTGSKKIATFMQAWTTLIYFLSLTSQWVTCGRMSWAFARDGGVPYSTFFSKIDLKYEIPVRTTILSVIFCSLYGLLYLASTNAFNSIVTSAVLYLNVTYCVPQAICAVQGRAKVLPKRPFDLGYIGLFCNIFSPIAVTIIAIFICFPTGVPTTVGTMNYTSVVLVGLFSIIIIFWFTMGKRFKGPTIDWDLLNINNERQKPAVSLAGVGFKGHAVQQGE